LAKRSPAQQRAPGAGRCYHGEPQKEPLQQQAAAGDAATSSCLHGKPPLPRQDPRPSPSPMTPPMNPPRAQPRPKAPTSSDATKSGKPRTCTQGLGSGGRHVVLSTHRETPSWRLSRSKSGRRAGRGGATPRGRGRGGGRQLACSQTVSRASACQGAEPTMPCSTSTCRKMRGGRRAGSGRGRGRARPP
jgi:hypothetical protein